MVASGDRSEANLIDRTLKDLGFFNVTRVDNGQAALNLVKFRPSYFLVTSWDLPQLSGLRLIEEIRKNKKTAGQPCLLIVPPDKEELTADRGLDSYGVLVRPISAKDLAEKIRDMMENRKDASWPKGPEEKAELLYKTGHQEEALAQYQETLQAGRKRMAGLNTEMGLIFIKQGRLEEAEAALQEAVKFDPWMTRAQSALGQIYLETGRPLEAGQALDKALSMDPHNEKTYLLMAESLLQSDQNDRAEKLFRNLLRRRPEDLYIFNRLGIALRKQSKYEQATAVYRQALKISDQDENLHFNLGRCLFEAGQLEKAAASLQRVLAINPDLKEAKVLMAEIRKSGG